MTSGELTRFAESLVRHLAAVIAGEQGYVESRCPGCSQPRPRRDAMLPPTPGILFERSDAHSARIAIASKVAAGACGVCHGGGRVWALPRRRTRPMSDRELINAAAVTRAPLVERERPRG